MFLTTNNKEIGGEGRCRTGRLFGRASSGAIQSCSGLSGPLVAAGMRCASSTYPSSLLKKSFGAAAAPRGRSLRCAILPARVGLNESPIRLRPSLWTRRAP